jgi:hypothetical protein
MKFHHHYVVLDKTATSEVLCAELNLPRWKEAKVITTHHKGRGKGGENAG